MNNNENNNIEQLNNEVRNSQNLNNSLDAFGVQTKQTPQPESSIQIQPQDVFGVPITSENKPELGQSVVQEIPQSSVIESNDVSQISNVQNSSMVEPVQQSEQISSNLLMSQNNNVDSSVLTLTSNEQVQNTVIQNQKLEQSSISPMMQQNNMEMPNSVIPASNEQSPSMATPVEQQNPIPVAQAVPQSNTSEQQVNIQSNTSLDNSSQVNTTTQDEELLKAYVGKNYDRISKKSFNLAGFFLTTLYLFYRKMFGYGILIFLGQTFLLFAPVIGLLSPLVVCILLGIFANKMYISKARKNIEKIKNGNPNLSQDELKNICSKKGGTSVGLAILGSIVNFVIASVIIFIFGATLLATLFTVFSTNIDVDSFNPIPSTSDYNQFQTEYDGTKYYDSDIKIANEYSIVVPSVFKQYEFFDDEYSYNYTYDSQNGVFNSCKFEMNKILGYTSAEKFANDLYNYNLENVKNSLSIQTINNINWYYFDFEDSFGQNYNYITEKNGAVYLLEYVAQEDAPQDCLTYKDQVLNSIKSL